MNYTCYFILNLKIIKIVYYKDFKIKLKKLIMYSSNLITEKVLAFFENY